VQLCRGKNPSSLKFAAFAAFMVLLLPGAARAEWLLTPSLGTTFGFDTFGNQDPMYGIAVAATDDEGFGVEGELSHAPGFFKGVSEVLGFAGQGSVTTATLDVLIGKPLPTRHGLMLRPYFSGGIGVMHMHVVSGPTNFVSNNNEAGWNAGAGAMAFFGDHLGLRGDVRYLRSFRNGAPSWTQGTTVDIAPGNFDFFRAAVGVTFRFGG
jgi:hypothetical protein